MSMRVSRATLDNGVYEKFALLSGHICNGFFSIGEDDFGTKRY